MKRKDKNSKTKNLTNNSKQKIQNTALDISSLQLNIQNSTLPEGWVWVRLGEVADIIMGQSPPSSTYNNKKIGLPFYQGKFEFGEMYPTPRVWCSKPKKIAENGDILLSVRAPVGPTNICNEKCCIGRGLAAVRYFSCNEHRFIFYFFRSIERQISRIGTGSTFSAISKSQIENLSFPLPPLPEQHRIVTKIEELFTKLDAGVEALKKAKEQIKRYRQAVLKYAFEGKLTEEWRVKNQPQETAEELLEKIKEERKKKLGKKYKARSERSRRELPPVDTSELPELPEGWVWVRVGEIYDIVGGGTPSTKVDKYWKGDIPWITSADIHGLKNIKPRKFITHEAILSSATNLVPENSLIVVTRVGLGKIAITKKPLCFSQDSQALIDRTHLIYPEYSLYCLSQIIQIFKYKNRGTTISGVTKKQLSELAFPLPPLPEQHRIVEEIERRFSVADEVEKAIDNSLKQAERLRQSILKNAFEGKLVPQDPNDEPAEKLLERIKNVK